MGPSAGSFSAAEYADNYMRKYLQKRQRAQHINAYVQCSRHRALFDGDVWRMYVCASYAVR